MSTNSGFKKVMMVGDFNHPQILWMPNPVIPTSHADPNHPDVLFVDMLNDAMLHQHVSQPTRDSDNQTPTIDDLLLTTDPDMIDDLEHLPHLGASDHQCLKFNVNHTCQKAKPIKTTSYVYNKADVPKMKQMLNIDWEAELHGKSADEGYSLFLDKYNAACKECIPTKTTTCSDKYIKPIWMKPATLRLIKRKHHAHTKKLNTKSDVDKESYRKLRNEVMSTTRSDRVAFERYIYTKK